MDNISQIERYLNKKDFEYKKFSGRDFDVFIVDDLVFRFPRSQERWKDIELEKNNIDIIKPYVTLPIPDYQIYDNFIVYPLIKGNMLGSDLDAYSDKVISQLVEFMQQLHSIPLEKFSQQERFPRSELEKFVEELKIDFDQKLFGKITSQTLKNLYDYIEELFLKYEYFKKAFIHTDLQGKNIIAHNSEISGIIDFTDSRICGIELDFARFYDMNPNICKIMVKKYFGFEDKNFLERVEFLSKESLIHVIHNDEVFYPDEDNILNKINKHFR